MPIVSTGQLTIVDQNDAKPITALISASRALQQAYSKDNGVELYTPNWSTSTVVLTANVFVGGVNVANDPACTGHTWSTSFNGASVGSTVSFTRNTNIPVADGAVTYYYRCIYTDPVTSVQTRIDAQVTLSVVQTGTNAVFVQITGTDVIKKAEGTTKNVAVMMAELVRSSGYDADNLQYRWYSISTAGVATKLHSAVAGVANYGVKSTPLASAPTATAADLGAAKFTAAGITTAGVTTSEADWCTAGSPGFNTLVIGEGAVNNTQLFQVEIRDTAEGAVASRPIYTTYFTISDVSDPYTCEVIAEAGDRLLNGTGSTGTTIKVYRGATEISSYSGWSFDWYLKNKLGSRVGFVAAASPPTPDLVRNITANTTGGITIDAIATLAANDLVKLVSSGGSVVKFAQVAASTGTAVTLVAPTGDNILVGAVGATGLVASEFVGGLLYKAVSKKTTSGTKVGITLTEHDIDGKNTVQVDVTQP